LSLWLPKKLEQEGKDIFHCLRNLSDQHRLNYLHLMNKAAESEDRQSYFHYLQQAEQVLRDTDEDAVWQPAD